jgi:hypothetical protein
MQTRGCAGDAEGVIHTFLVVVIDALAVSDYDYEDDDDDD